MLYLPVADGGQGLIDIRSRIAAFRLQSAQRLLYKKGIPWTETAAMLLRGIKNLTYDKHLFLIDISRVLLTDTTPFYRSLLQVLQRWNTVNTLKLADLLSNG